MTQVVTQGTNSARSALAVLLLFTSLLSATGCFRYTPSRKEMVGSGDVALAGPEAFQAYQARLRDRLTALVKDRAPLLDPLNQQKYLVGPGDVLRVDVFGFSDLGGELEISEDGSISPPLIGPVNVAGKDIIELQRDLTMSYMRFVKSPKVRVTVNRYTAHRVSVVGAVPRPGFYSLKRSGYLLTEVLAEVGGPKEGSEGRIYLMPASAAKPFGEPSVGAIAPAAASTQANSAPDITGMAGAVEIDLEELNGTLEKPPILIPLISGDTIIVPDAGQFRVEGEVESPGSFPIGHRTSTLSAVAAAGGFTYAANVNEVEVIRDIGAGKKASVTVDLEQVAFHGLSDVGLRTGDVIIVPSAPGRFRARQLVEAFRSVFRGGVSGSIKYQ